MTRTSSKFVAFAFAAVGALALIAAPALADTVKAKVVYGDTPAYDDEIVVTAPRVWHEDSGERSSSTGARIETVSVRNVVSAADLDLRYDADVRELRRRIETSATQACIEAEHEGTGVPVTTRRQCVREAARDAQAQADELIAYMRG